jgi:glycosyltransferase involved in cell wall biosynthesis
MLWCLANLYRIPLIFIGETQLRKSTSLRQKLKDLLLPLFFKGVDQVVSIGNQSKEFYQHYGVANSKITEAKYCVDNAFFSHAAEGAKPKTSPFTILFVGRLFKRKRPNDLIALMEKLKGLPVEALVVGTGPLENELKERAKHLPQIKFLGFKSQPEVREIYPQCDLLFVPSEYETWGLVINEAMCAKVPALVTSTCGAANDLVIPNETGFVFSVGDIQMAKEKIEKCLTDSSFFQKLKENAYQRVTHSYQPIQFANKIYEAFSMSRGQIESNTRSRFVIGS